MVQASLRPELQHTDSSLSCVSCASVLLVPMLPWVHPSLLDHCLGLHIHACHCSAACPLPHHHLSSQGISVKMVTGDHLLIGKETAKMLGMGTEVSGAARRQRRWA